jgi:hypothetical protein
VFKIKVSNKIIDYATSLVKDIILAIEGWLMVSAEEQLTGIMDNAQSRQCFHVDLLTEMKASIMVKI